MQTATKEDRQTYHKAGNGRRPYPLSVVLWVHCLQLFYNLSDPAMEELTKVAFICKKILHLCRTHMRLGFVKWHIQTKNSLLMGLATLEPAYAGKIDHL